MLNDLNTMNYFKDLNKDGAKALTSVPRNRNKISNASNIKAAMLRNNLISKRDLMKMYQPPKKVKNLKMNQLFITSSENVQSEG